MYGFNTFGNVLSFLTMHQIDLLIEKFAATSSLFYVIAHCCLTSLVFAGTLFVDLQTSGKLLEHLLLGRTVTSGEPGMANQVSDTQTLVRVVLQHAGDQVFEVV